MPIDIASGLRLRTHTCNDALAIVARYGSSCPAGRDILESGRGESVKPGDPILARSTVRMIATPQMASRRRRVSRARQRRILHSRRRHRRTSARRGKDWRHGAAVAERNQPFGAPALLLSARNHGHRTRQRARGRQCRVFAVLAIGIRPPADPCARRTRTGVDGQER